jgi:hypothetical protein
LAIRKSPFGIETVHDVVGFVVVVVFVLIGVFQEKVPTSGSSRKRSCNGITRPHYPKIGTQFSVGFCPRLMAGTEICRSMFAHRHRHHATIGGPGKAKTAAPGSSQTGAAVGGA